MLLVPEVFASKLLAPIAVFVGLSIPLFPPFPTVIPLMEASCPITVSCALAVPPLIEAMVFPPITVLAVRYELSVFNIDGTVVPTLYQGVALAAHVALPLASDVNTLPAPGVPLLICSGVAKVNVLAPVMLVAWIKAPPNWVVVPFIVRPLLAVVTVAAGNVPHVV